MYIMLCPNCESVLKESDVFCPVCGSACAEAAEDPALTEEMPAAEQTVAEEETAVEETSFDDLMNEAAALIREPDLEVEEVEQTVEEAAPAVYSNPAPAKKVKKNHGATPVLIAIIAVLFAALLVSGFFLFAEITYNQAVVSLQHKEYDQALESYEKFSFYKDCQAQAEELNRLQTAYDQALALLPQHQYVEAKVIFQSLGDYRDSLDQLMYQVPYQQAAYLMAGAAANDKAALPQHPAYQPENAYSDNVTPMLYKGAAQLLIALGDFQDSAVLSSQCYLNAAAAYMDQGLFEEAFACQEFMNAADQEAVMALYMTFCADDTAWTDLLASVKARMELDAQYNDDPTMTQKELVDAELEIMGAYAEDLLFHDQELKALVSDYLAALEAEAAALNESGFWADRSAWYAGNAMRYAVIEALIEKYDFLAEDAEAQASFAGLSEKYTAFSAVEKALDAQILNAQAENSDEDGDYYTFENNTGYAFSLIVTHTYYDEEGEEVLFHEAEALTIGVGETVKVTFMTPDDDDNWETCNIAWTYELKLA